MGYTCGKCGNSDDPVAMHKNGHLCRDCAIAALRARVAVLEEVADWACKKLGDEISFSKQHFESSTNEDCVCWLCDETAFAEIIRRRAKEG